MSVNAENEHGADYQRTGEDVYKTSCFACHDTGAIGAPSTSAEWAPRIKKDRDLFLERTLNGFNAMPPKGGCVVCSEKELKLAIDFIIKNSK